MTRLYRKKLEIISHSPEITHQLAGEFVAEVRAGQTVALIGSLGAGKTTFVRGIMRALDFHDPVRSPSFTLTNYYPSSPPVLHVDLYRINDASELISLDLEHHAPFCIILVEWADKFDLEPAPDWKITFTTFKDGPDKRLIQVESCEPE